MVEMSTPVHLMVLHSDSYPHFAIVSRKVLSVLGQPASSAVFLRQFTNRLLVESLWNTTTRFSHTEVLRHGFKIKKTLHLPPAKRILNGLN